MGCRKSSTNNKSKEPETFKIVRSGNQLTVAAISLNGEVHLYRGEVQQGIFTVTSEVEKVIRRGNTVKIKDIIDGALTNGGKRISVSRRYFMDDQLVGSSAGI